MRDLKSAKSIRVKGNRRKREKVPRDWKKFFRRLVRVGTAVGTAVLVIGGGILLTRLFLASDFVRVQSVRVENEHRVSADEIAARSDIKLGSSLFELDLEMIGKKIEEEPWVESARVERVFPREVVIRVEEREPRAIVYIDYLYYLDAGGTVFKTLDATDSLAYPVITGLDQRYLLEHPAEARGLFLQAIELLDQLQCRKIFALTSVSEVRIDPEQGLELYTYNGGVPVLFGRGSFAAKLDRLEEIYRDLEPRLAELQYIDLNVSDRVIVKVDTRKPSRG